MCSSILTEELGLGSIIRLPPFAEGMVHTIVCEVVIFEIEVVKIVACGLNLLPLQDSDELRLSLFISDHDFGIFLLLNVCLGFLRQLAIAVVNFLKLCSQERESHLVIHHFIHS